MLVPVGAEYGLLVASSEAAFTVQAHRRGPGLEIVFASAPPGEETVGLDLEPGEGVTRLNGSGNCYGRSRRSRPWFRRSSSFAVVMT